MTGPPIIQLPMLRPDPVHESRDEISEGLGSLAKLLAAHQAQQQQLLMHRGQLAIEQARLDFEKQQATEKRKQIEAGIAAIDQMHGIPQKPTKQQGQAGQPAQPAQFGGMGVVQPSQPQDQQAQPQQQPQQQGSLGAIAAMAPGLAEEFIRQQHQQEMGQRFAGVLTNYTGAQLRNDPNKRAEAVSKLMGAGVDPAAVDAWLRANPPRETVVRMNAAAMMRVDKQTGEILGVTPLGTTAGKELGTLQGRFRAFGPQYNQGIEGMYAVEKMDPNAANTVLSVALAGGIPLDSKELLKRLGEQTFSGNAFKYRAFLKSSIEASLGLQPMARSGPQFLDLIANVLTPSLAALRNQQGELEVLQSIRRERLAGFREHLNDLMFGGMGDAQQPQQPGGTPQQPKSQLDILGAAADSLRIKY